MIERKYYLHRHYLSLNHKTHQHIHLSHIQSRIHKTCLISLLSSSELHCLFHYLPLDDLTRLHQAFNSSKKTKEGSKAIVCYIARNPRVYTNTQHRQFTEYMITRKRKLTKWRICDKLKDRCEWQRINWDIDRTYLLRYKKINQLEDMRTYLRRVLYRITNEVNRFTYIQGFHCIIKAIYEIDYKEQEAYHLCCYLLRDMKLNRYYQNRLEKMRELCYVLDVYVYNNLPEIHFHLKRNQMTAQCYALSWFVTLYSQQLPLNILSRLWILFLLKGWKVLIKFGVALLCTFQQQILRKDDSQLPEYLRGLQSVLNSDKQKQLWQLFSSIKVTNKMVGYLSRQMHNLEYDREISVMQFKQMRDSGCVYESLQTIQTQMAPQYQVGGVCCERVESFSTFPYCHDF